MGVCRFCQGGFIRVERRLLVGRSEIVGEGMPIESGYRGEWEGYRRPRCGMG